MSVYIMYLKQKCDDEAREATVLNQKQTIIRPTTRDEGLEEGEGTNKEGPIAVFTGILDEIDENEDKQQKEWSLHWWNNFRFIRGAGWSANVSQELKKDTLGLTSDEQTQIKGKLAKSTAAEWELCSKTFTPEITNKFEKWYQELMNEKQSIIADMDRIKTKALHCAHL